MFRDGFGTALSEGEEAMGKGGKGSPFGGKKGGSKGEKGFRKGGGKKDGGGGGGGGPAFFGRPQPQGEAPAPNGVSGVPVQPVPPQRPVPPQAAADKADEKPRGNGGDGAAEGRAAAANDTDRALRGMALDWGLAGRSGQGQEGLERGLAGMSAVGAGPGSHQGLDVLRGVNMVGLPALNAPAQQGMQDLQNNMRMMQLGTTTVCIRMRGLPWASTEVQVKDFFQPLRVVRVAFLFDRTGKAKGECFVRFESDEMAKQALSKDRQYMGHRFVECYLQTVASADRAEAASVDQTKDSLYIRLRGLPFSAKEGEIVEFLGEHRVNAVPGSVIIEFGADGRHSGCATVKLFSISDADLAVSLHRQIRFGSRYVEVFRTTEQDALQVQQTHGGASAEAFVVKLRGLPMTSTELDVVDFMSGVNVVPKGIHMVDNDYGRVNGTCFVHLQGAADLDRALEKDKGQMGSRYIEVHRSTLAAMADANPPPKEPEPSGPYVVWLRGLPFTVTGVDIVKQLFPDLDIIPQGVHLVLEDDGRSHGQAYVEFSTADSFTKALSRTGRLMCKNYAQQASHTGRSIDVIRSTHADMRAAGDYVNEEVVVVKRKHPGEVLGCQLDGMTLAGVADSSALARHGGEQFVQRIIRKVNDIDVTSAVELSKALARNSTADMVTLKFEHVLYTPNPIVQQVREYLTTEPTSDWSKDWMRCCSDSGLSCDPSPNTVDLILSRVGLPPQANSAPLHPLVGRRINLAQRQRDIVAKIGRSIMQKGEYSDVPVEKDPVKYVRGTRLLLVGEGNFAYAAALTAHFGNAPNIVATGYDSKEYALKLPNGEINVMTAHQSGATVLHDVDATKLETLGRGLFDFVRWNNPHSGAYPTGAENVASNQCLLEAFLRSAVNVLKPGGEIHIVSSQHSMKKWRIEEMGNPTVACVKIERHVNPFMNYVSQRSRGGALPDAAHTVKIYTFRRQSEIPEHMPVVRTPVHQPPPTTYRKGGGFPPTASVAGGDRSSAVRNSYEPPQQQQQQHDQQQPPRQPNSGYYGSNGRNDAASHASMERAQLLTAQLPHPVAQVQPLSQPTHSPSAVAQVPVHLQQQPQHFYPQLYQHFPQG
eukprot:gene13079-20174_t